MSLATGIIKLASVRMGDLVADPAAMAAANPPFAQAKDKEGGQKYVPIHLRGKQDQPQVIPVFTEGEFPTMGGKTKAAAGGGVYAAAAVRREKEAINFKEMMKAQEDRVEVVDERQQMINDGWVFLPLKDAKAIIQRW
jgi:hypothetical protein